MRRIAKAILLLFLILIVASCQSPAFKSGPSGVLGKKAALRTDRAGKEANQVRVSERKIRENGKSSTPVANLRGVADRAAPPEAAALIKPPPIRLAQATQEKRKEGEPPSVIKPAIEGANEEAEAETDEKYVALNFDNADVYDFIQSISEITGINYILAPGVAGKITVQMSGKIPVRDVLKLMDTILEVYNLAAVKSGDMYKLVPIAEVQRVGPEFRVGREITDFRSKDRVVVQIIKLDYMSPAGALEVIQPFMSVHGEAVPFPRLNLLIVIDTVSNVGRVLELLELFDVDLFKNLGVHLYPVQNVSPIDLAEELQKIFTALGITDISSGGGLEIIPFERINSLMLIASTAHILQSAISWLEELDRASEDMGVQTYVYYVENGEATNIGSILSQLYISTGKKPTRAPGTVGKNKRAPAAGQKRQPASAKPKIIRESSLTGLLSGEIKIVADEATNALIIQATPGDYKIIVKTIEGLDLRPKQVLIEVLIAEVTLTKGLDFGVQWAIGHARKSKSTAGVAKSIFAQPSSAITDIASFRDFFAALASSTTGFTYSLATGDELFMLIDALATVTDVDILSSPNILASDNKEASINVGDEVPVVTSEQIPVGVDQARFRNIQYRQTGITLTVTPHINSKNLVTMDISQEVSEVAAAGVSGVQAETPTISTRNIKTTIVVKDGQTILMGGLISRKKEKVVSKVPILGDIPLLGALFRTNSESYRKRELILLITPRVVSTDEEAGKLTGEFKDRIESLKGRIEELRGKKKRTPRRSRKK